MGRLSRVGWLRELPWRTTRERRRCADAKVASSRSRGGRGGTPGTLAGSAFNVSRGTYRTGGGEWRRLGREAKTPGPPGSDPRLRAVRLWFSVTPWFSGLPGILAVLGVAAFLLRRPPEVSGRTAGSARSRAVRRTGRYRNVTALR